MKLDIYQIKDITLGAVNIEKYDNSLNFHRFTKEQEDIYLKSKNTFHKKLLLLLE